MHYSRAAVEWSPRGDFLLAQVQNRSQSELRLLRLDPQTGERIDPNPLLLEVAREGGWVNINNKMLHVLKMENHSGSGGWSGGGGGSSSLPKAGDFIWVSEKTGFAHLYLHCGATVGCQLARDGDGCNVAYSSCPQATDVLVLT